MRALEATLAIKDQGEYANTDYGYGMETTCLHITGTQAIQLMRAARARSVVTAAPASDVLVQPAANVLSAIEDPRLSKLFNWLNISPSHPLEVLVPDATQRCWAQGIKTSVLTKELPPGAFLELADGLDDEQSIHLPDDVRILIDSPALAYVHAARELHKKFFASTDDESERELNELEAKLRLIALASEMCGSYARNPLKPFAQKCYYDKPKEDGRFTTREQLNEFLQHAQGMDGIKFARLMSRYVIDGSGSPMETFINYGLTLPPRLAGLSMAQPLVNEQLVLSDETKLKLINHDSLRPDFQWPDLHVLAEYLGDKEHASHDARVEDKNRLQDYMTGDYKAFFLMFDDVKSTAAFNRTAMRFADEFAKNGKAYEPHRVARIMRDEEFQKRQTKLMTTLLPPLLRYEEG